VKPIEDMRSGDLGAIELGDQRGNIQEEPLQYMHFKHTGDASDSCAIIDDDTFRNPHGDLVPEHIELGRFTDEM
jgi:methylmalonyl-CoA mutase